MAENRFASAPPIGQIGVMKIPPEMFAVEERIAMATRCRDCDPVPKVADAGMVLEQADGRRVQVMHNGLRVVEGGYYGQWMTDLIRLCRGHHETQEERLFHEVVKRLPVDATMIELGGFWSYYSLWFLKDHPQRRSVVIEPDPTHLEIGRANAAINQLAPIFKAGFAGASFAPEVAFATEVSGVQTLPRYSVQHLFEEQGWPKIDLLHLDIQGAEVEVVESCRDLFAAGLVDWIFVSTHAHQISGDPLTHQRCLAALRECGAIIEADHDVHESFSGDGLIVARFCSAPADWVPVELSHNRSSHALFRHLGYDLQQAREHISALQAEVAWRVAPETVNPRLADSGALYVLSEDGPLGHSGEFLLLPRDQVMSPSVRAHGVWDEENLTAFADKVKPGVEYTLVDVGANIGLFSRQMGRAVPAIERTLCIEPEPNNYRALSYNMAGRPGGIELFNLALGAEDGAFTFYRDAENIGNYSLNPDAMRDRPHDTVEVKVRQAGTWLSEQLNTSGPLLWKSDTQGSDELIVSQVPIDIWNKVDVALMEMWRIAKPDYDQHALIERIECFPNRQLGDRLGVSARDVLDYLSGRDWAFKDLLLWR
jgi:FkbM family methyltransferase